MSKKEKADLEGVLYACSVGASRDIFDLRLAY